MSNQHEYILQDSNISTLSVYALLRHTGTGVFLENKYAEDIYPLVMELDSGIFTKGESNIGYPEVAVSQSGTTLFTSCSCAHAAGKLCEHQAEVIYCLLEHKDYRIFFDASLRQKRLRQIAKSYGLEEEDQLENYFFVRYDAGKLTIVPKDVKLLRYDEAAISRDILPKGESKLAQLAKLDVADKRQILVLSKHRYYNQIHFLLMHADFSATGKVKNPLEVVEPTQLIWSAVDPQEIKFYSAIASFQQVYSDEFSASQLEALKLIINNPLGLAAYYHDRTISEKINAKSIQPIVLDILQAEIELHVFKKEPFYEISGELRHHDISVPFKNVVIRHDCFVVHQNRLSLISNPDLLRVINYFKSHNEILLIHSSKYDGFMKTILTKLEQFVHIRYSYIKSASPAQLAEKDFAMEKIIYLRQEGSYVAITPVMKYGAIEVPVYSRQQIFDTDLNGNEFQVTRDLKAEDDLTSMVMRQHPDFAEQIQDHEYFSLHKDRFLDDQWFLQTFEVWREEGIQILGFNDLTTNQLNPHVAKIHILITSGLDWFNATLEVSFGEKRATIRQLHKAIRNKSKFVQLDDGSQGILPEEWIEKIGKYFQAAAIKDELLLIPKIKFTELATLFDRELLSTEIHEEVASYTTQFSDLKSIPSIQVPADLQATLRDYQHEGLNWLNLLDSFNFGGCLADDMGLGKTLQIIAFILSQRNKGRNNTNLIVVPTSLLLNWQEEINKFAPSLKVLLYYGTDRLRDTSSFDGYEVVLTSYGMMLSDVNYLKKYFFNYIFLDESQAIKNPNSERYKAARLLQSRNKIVLTGTPIENNTFDLYGQLSFACPGLLGSKQFFKDTYATPIDTFQNSKRAAELQAKIQPFILRRTKRQVASELPEKTEMVIYCEMNAEQRKVYSKYETALRDYIASSDDVEIDAKRMHVLSGLTQLRLICNSPILLKEGYGNEHAVKIEVLMEQIESKVGQHKILVFSQFVGMLDLIKAELERKNIRFAYLTGKTTKRGEEVNSFQTDDHIRVFLISLKAGGVGLNLTEADYVFLVDPWWNPAAENQAIDRCYRIGQSKKVIAVRLICADTIEEKIMKLQKKKNRIAENLIQTDAVGLGGMSKSSLLDIL